jgi:outer membrane usher protein FimD/PapC
VLAVDGAWGLSRRTSDSFVLARLGVPQPGVDIYLNNQRQGTTDADGLLFVPGVGAFGRQDVSLDDKQLPMQFSLARRRFTVTPPFKSGTVVDFRATRVRALAGMAWQVEGGARQPIASHTWTMKGSAGSLAIETAKAGDFYLEHAPPGEYAGSVAVRGKTYTCRMKVPDFAEAVHELREGIVCE